MKKDEYSETDAQAPDGTGTRSGNRPARQIVLVTETFVPDINGVANTLRYLCEGLLAHGHAVTVVRPAPASLAPANNGVSRVRGEPTIGEPSDLNLGGGSDLNLGGAFREVRVDGVGVPGYPGLRLGLPAGRLLSRLWRECRPDVVYLATEGPLGWTAGRAADALGIPTVAGFHTNFQSYSRYYGVGFLERVIACYLRAFHNRVGLTLVPTSLTQTRVERLGIGRTALWSRGVDCDRFSPARRCSRLRAEWGLQETDLAVIYVGRLAAEKNLAQAAETFERLRGIHSRARFILVGDGPLRQRFQVRHPDYLFCGTQRDQALARHYASADLLLFPSKTDTFGNVVIEAMASGLAVVAFDDGAAREHIETSVNGMKVAPSDDEGFTRLALQLAAQPSIRRRICSAARATALTLHWEQLIDQFESLIFRHRPEMQAHADQQSLATLRADRPARIHAVPKH